MAVEYSYTTAEKARRARLLLRGAHGAYGDTGAIERQIERIDADAADRARRESAALNRQLEAARDELAAARVAERVADRHARADAREARKTAEKRLRALERAAR